MEEENKLEILTNEELNKLSEDELFDLYCNADEYRDCLKKLWRKKQWESGNFPDYTGKYVCYEKYNSIIYMKVESQDYDFVADREGTSYSTLMLRGEYVYFETGSEGYVKIKYENKKAWHVGDIYDKHEIKKKMKVISEEEYRQAIEYIIKKRLP